MVTNLKITKDHSIQAFFRMEDLGGKGMYKCINLFLNEHSTIFWFY